MNYITTGFSARADDPIPAAVELDVGLDLFNEDTHPSGHISRPTHVNVFQSCFHSLKKSLKSDYIVHVWGLVEFNKLHQIKGYSSEKLYRMSDRSYQMKESHFL